MQNPPQNENRKIEKSILDTTTPPTSYTHPNLPLTTTTHLPPKHTHSTTTDGTRILTSISHIGFAMRVTTFHS